METSVPSPKRQDSPPGHGTKIAAAETPRDQAQSPQGVPLSPGPNRPVEVETLVTSRSRG